MSTLEGAPPLENAWYAVAERKLVSRPVPAEVLGHRLVLFPAHGQVVALADACPHRGAPLSLGRCQGDQIECPYHGWRFDGAGRCRAVPAMPEAKLGPAHSVRSYAVRESEGFVWVCVGDRPPSFIPRAYPDPAAGYVSFVQDELLPADLISVAENILDVPHTAYLHGGLFRRAPSRRQRVHIRRTTKLAAARFIDEKVPGGLLGRLLSGGRNATLEHEDRFELPSLAIVDYRLGEAHLQIRNLLTPVDRARTRVIATANLRMGPLGRPVAWLAAPAARRVLAQDERILEAIATQPKTPRGVSTQADLLRPHIRRLLLDAARGEETSAFEKKVEIRV